MSCRIVDEDGRTMTAREAHQRYGAPTVSTRERDRLEAAARLAALRRRARLRPRGAATIQALDDAAEHVWTL